MRTRTWTTSVLAAALATIMLAAPTLADDNDDAGYRIEIIEGYVDPCTLAIVRANPATESIPDEDITLIVRTFTRNGLEEMLDIWVPKVKAMTDAERHVFYAERLEWCISTYRGTEEREGIQDIAEAVE